jgi:protein SCO1/2/putative membrane protein
MKGLQAKLHDTSVRLVSVSVDPTYDTPEVLARYAQALGADPERWWFLTGPKDDVYRLILDRFHVPVSETSVIERAQGAEDVAHSAKLALVDRGNRVVGYYNSDDAHEVEALQQRARKIDNVWARRLPTINATLNGSSAVVLLVGWSLIRAGRVSAHRACMLSALALSLVFLGCYLLYHFVVIRGSVPFQGSGRGLRVAYYTVLLSHTVLAIAMVPLAATTLVAALRGRFDKHARWAKLTFPIWLYVSITGVIVYWMLYRVDYGRIVVGSA